MQLFWISAWLPTPLPSALKCYSLRKPFCKKWLFLEDSDSLPCFPAITFCQGFPDSELLMFWAGKFFTVGDSPAHCRMGGSLPGFYSLNASSISLVMITKNVSGHCQRPLGHQICHRCSATVFKTPSSKIIHFIQQQILTHCLTYARHDSRYRRQSGKID